jgi:hypothetical protein
MSGYISEQARMNQAIFEHQMLQASLCQQVAAGGGQQGPLSIEPFELHCPLGLGDIASGTNRQLDLEQDR